MTVGKTLWIWKSYLVLPQNFKLLHFERLLFCFKMQVWIPGISPIFLGSLFHIYFCFYQNKMPFFHMASICNFVPSSWFQFVNSLTAEQGSTNFEFTLPINSSLQHFKTRRELNGIWRTSENWDPEKLGSFQSDTDD